MTYIRGTSLNDSLIAGIEDASVIHGLNGNDTLIGSMLEDYLEGDAGHDLLNGGRGDDALSGNNGNDTLNGEFGFDSLNGGAGNDYLYGGTGGDIFDGGLGLDRLYMGNDENTDIILLNGTKQPVDRVSEFHAGEDMVVLYHDPNHVEYMIRIMQVNVDFDGDGDRELTWALQYQGLTVDNTFTSWVNLLFFDGIGSKPVENDIHLL